MRVPVLPFVDLLILLASGSLVVGGVLKVVYVATNYSSRLFGLAPVHYLTIAGILLLLAVALTGRAWLQSYETPQLLATERASSTLDAYMAVRAQEQAVAQRAPTQETSKTTTGSSRVATPPPGPPA